MFSVLAARSRSSRSSWGSASACPARSRIASTLPVLIRAPNSSSVPLDRVLARDTVAHRQRRDRRLQARAEAALGYLVGEPRARALSALRTAQALSTVLDHPHHGRGAALRPGGAPAHRGQVRSSAPKTCPQRQRSGQCSTTSSTAHAGSSERPWPSWPSWAPRSRPEGSLPRRGRDGASELGGREELRELFAQLPLEPPTPRLELLDTAIHPQQDLDNDLPTSVIDRLRLGAVHSLFIRRRPVMSPGPTERLRKVGPFVGTSTMEPAGIEPATSCLQSRRSPI